jgi:hypothetical protein
MDPTALEHKFIRATRLLARTCAWFSHAPWRNFAAGTLLTRFALVTLPRATGVSPNSDANFTIRSRYPFASPTQGEYQSFPRLDFVSSPVSQTLASASRKCARQMQ